jgi:hypothetical protein
VRFYDTRGTAEEWIKQATRQTRLSRHRFQATDARLEISVRETRREWKFQSVACRKRHDVHRETTLHEGAESVGPDPRH